MHHDFSFITPILMHNFISMLRRSFLGVVAKSFCGGKTWASNQVQFCSSNNYKSKKDLTLQIIIS